MTSKLATVTYWAPIADSGRAYIWAYRSHSRKPYVNAGLSLYNAGASEIWHTLKADEASYTETFGESLRWSSNKTGTAFHIQTDNRPSSLEEDDWAAQYEWLAERMVRFGKLFSGRVKQLIDELDVAETLGFEQSKV